MILTDSKSWRIRIYYINYLQVFIAYKVLLAYINLSFSFSLKGVTKSPKMIEKAWPIRINGQARARHFKVWVNLGPTGWALMCLILTQPVHVMHII